MSGCWELPAASALDRELVRAAAWRHVAETQNRTETRFLNSATLLSGCWELNPVYMLPKHAYYRYTTARI